MLLIVINEVAPAAKLICVVVAIRCSPFVRSLRSANSEFYRALSSCLWRHPAARRRHFVPGRGTQFAK
jgi:hypothetical protein